jgi:hypothetical protein
MVKRGKIGQEKKAMEMAFSMFVSLVIAIILLILIIVFITGGFTNFKEKFSLFAPSSNVDALVTNCNNLVINDAKYEYCCTNKTVSLSAKQKFEMTCSQIANQSYGTEITKLNCQGAC